MKGDTASILEHFKGRTNEQNKEVTTLDWNVSYTILYYVKEHFYILVSSFERESCEYPNFPVLLDWFRKKGHYLQLVVMMDKQGW